MVDRTEPPVPGAAGDDLVQTGVVDLNELDALLRAAAIDPLAAPVDDVDPSLPIAPPDDRAALARLEDLDEVLDRAGRARDDAPAPPTTTISGATTDAPSPSSGSGLLRSNLIVATGTTLSRLTGLIRVMTFSAVIGSGALGDAYLIGNETPNIVYELLLGGLLSATLVPLFTTFAHDDDRERGEVATNAIITVTLAALAVLTVLAVLGAPLIFRLYTVNTEGDVDPEVLRQVGTLLTRVFLVQIFFYGATALFNAYLNSRRRFFAAAWSPILSNVVVIATLLTLSGRAWELSDVLTDDRLRLTLSLGTTAGIAAMALVLLPAVRRAGLRFRPVFQPRHPAIRQLVRMSAWTLGYVVCNQVVVIVIRNLSGPGSGDSSAYFFAYTFFVLPHALLSMSIATTFVPELARAVDRRDRWAFIDRASLGVRLIALFTIPAAVALFVLRRPIVGLFLQDSAAKELEASRALAGFAIGLVGFSLYLFTLRGFYAHKDTRTPFVINIGQCLLNIVFGVAFVAWWGILGLAAAFALSYVLASLWSLQVLSYKVRGFPLRSVLSAIFTMAVAGTLAGEVAWFIARHVGSNTGIEAVARLLAASLGGLVTYVAILAVLGSPEIRSARSLVRRRA